MTDKAGEQVPRDYKDHFDQRGSSYESAMRKFPCARRQEFAQVIESVRLTPGMTVADVPSGGGYLQDHLPAGCTWLGHEPCASFGQHGAMAVQSSAFLPLPWRCATVDVAISVAGVHHIQDKRPFFSELHRVVRPGGKLVVSDVAKDSCVARFLDEYVGMHNSTGHEGVYLDSHTLSELQGTGWHVHSHRICDFHWLFADRAAMASFCHGLFGLSSSSTSATHAAIEAHLGVQDFPDGSIGMAWSLMTIVAERN